MQVSLQEAFLLCLPLPRHRDFASADATKGLSDRPLDAFGHISFFRLTYILESKTEDFSHEGVQREGVQGNRLASGEFREAERFRSEAQEDRPQSPLQMQVSLQDESCYASLPPRHKKNFK